MPNLVRDPRGLSRSCFTQTSADTDPLNKRGKGPDILERKLHNSIVEQSVSHKTVAASPFNKEELPKFPTL